MDTDRSWPESGPRFDEVVVGVNFGPGGDAAVALALRLVSGAGRMTLTNIVPSDPTVFRGGRDDIVAAERGRSLALLERERSLIQLSLADARPPRIQTCALVAASPGRGLHAVAQRLRADVIVVGASRRGGLGRALLGDDTRSALRRAPCAVAVAPRDYAADRPSRPRDVGAGEAALSREVDLLVLEPGRRSERLARLAVRPLLVMAGTPGPRRAVGSPAASSAP
jgi:nucleotide-binding universal stress UspA family protein